MPTPLPVGNFPFYFGGGGPGAGYYGNLFDVQQGDLLANAAGVGIPALTASSASSPSVANYRNTPYDRGGAGQANAQGAFGNLLGGISSAQAQGSQAQGKLQSQDVGNLGNTVGDYASGLSSAIQNAIEANRISAEKQLQTYGLISGLLNTGLQFGSSVLGGPGSNKGLLSPFGQLIGGVTGLSNTGGYTGLGANIGNALGPGVSSVANLSPSDLFYLLMSGSGAPSTP
jgi:hypothetical protein